MVHPWRELRSLSHITLHWTTDLPAKVWAYTDGAGIWIDSRHLQAERRCALEHELEHLRRGHDSHQCGAEEASVRLAVARRLIPLPLLAEALAWSRDQYEIADECWVSVPVVRTRLENLTEAEQAELDGRIGTMEERDEMTDDETTMLFIAGDTGRLPGHQERRAREELSMTLTQLMQRVNVLIDRPDVNEAHPVLAGRLRRLREQRMERRHCGFLSDFSAEEQTRLMRLAGRL